MSVRRFVVNASPLILLSKIGSLQLLNDLADEVVAPAAVMDEVRAGQEGKSELRRIEAASWLRVEPDVEVPPEVAGWDLGPGESQVLAFARVNPRWEAVLDDKEARECARSLGILVTGTLGAILRAKIAGLIPAARPLIEKLIQRGAYLSRDLIEAALADIGE